MMTDTHDEQVARQILADLFPSRMVSDVRKCRNCPCPVVHMEHLTLSEALALEQQVHTLLGHADKEEWDNDDL